MKKLTKNDYQISQWSGGSTTQLAIFPAEADYSTRDFSWRISSATVELEHSSFTPLSGVDRIIAPLSGDLKLSFDKAIPITLKPFEQISFGGTTPTESWGKVVDFNVMTKGDFSANLQHLSLKNGEEHQLNLIENISNCFIYCYHGSVQVNSLLLESSDSCMTDELQTLNIKALADTDLMVVIIKSRYEDTK